MYQDNPPTEIQSGHFFLPEWVTMVFYGGHWEAVKAGTFQERVDTDHGPMAVYVDPFNDDIVFVLEPVTGFKIKKPEPPPEPQASVTELHPKK